MYVYKFGTFKLEVYIRVFSHGLYFYNLCFIAGIWPHVTVYYETVELQLLSYVAGWQQRASSV